MGGALKISETKISGVFTVKSDVHADARGEFSRLYCKKELSSFLAGQSRDGKNRDIVQINRSKTVEPNTIRGLHFQIKPLAEMKFIRCLQGAVWDVALDLRKDSSTFKQWVACELTPENNLMMVVPEGVAHGFQTLKDNTELLYLHTEYYSPQHEGGVKYDDPSVNIDWPEIATGVSDRDNALPFLLENFKGLVI